MAPSDKQMAMANISDIDWINDLPDELLENIVSFLKPKEAVQTGAVSRRWKNLWACSPRIVLDRDDFDCNEKFKEFGDNILSRRASSFLHMLSISSRYDLHHADVLARWINSAINFKVRVFALQGRVINLDFVKCIFNCASIRDMCLDIYHKHDGLLDKSKIIPSTVNLPHLKRLHLKHACFSEKDVARLFKGCPVLEDITFHSCCGTLCPVFTQKLTSLSIEDMRINDLIISDTQPAIIDLPFVRTLHITYASISDEGVARLLAGCPLLEDLYFENCYGNFLAFFKHKVRCLSLKGRRMHRGNVSWDFHRVLLTLNLSGDDIDLLKVPSGTSHPIHVKFVWNTPKRDAQDFGSNFDPSIIFSGIERLKLCFPDTKVDLKKDLRRIKGFNNLKSLSVELVDWCMHPYEFDLVVWFLHNSPSIEELILYNPKRKGEVSRKGRPKPVVLCNEGAYYNSLAIELSEFNKLKRLEIKFCSNLFRDRGFRKPLLKKMKALVNANVVISEYDVVPEHF